MDALRAIEIEKLKPVKNGIYVCIDPVKKKFELLNLEDIYMKIDDKETTLKDYLMANDKEITVLKNKIIELQTEHNKLLEAFKHQVILNALK